jgi:uncharacterized membrane protein YbhN (UPF0104 family)
MKTKSLIRIVFSLALVLLILKTVDMHRLATTLGDIPLRTAAVVIIGYGIGQLLSSLKWWRILHAGGIEISYPTALRAYFAGMFVNCFGLGMTGGDVARGILAAQGLPKKAEGIASVVADRVHGLTVLGLIALVSATTIGDSRVPASLTGALALITTGFIFLWVLGPWLLHRFKWAESSKFGTKLRQLSLLFPRSPRTLVTISLISALFHSVQIGLHAEMARGLGVSIPLSTLFVVIPFVNIASSLPISWQGLGVREKSYTQFFVATTPAILTKEQVIALGALWLAAITITSAIGGVIALASGDLKLLKAEQRAPENGAAPTHVGTV